MDPPRLELLLPLQGEIVFRLAVARLSLELEATFVSTRVQRTLGKRFAHLAAGLGLVAAVAESTASGQRLDIRERGVQSRAG